MSITIPSGLQAHYDSRGLSVAVGLLVTRGTDNAQFGFTSADVPLTRDGVEYEPNSLIVSAINSAGDMSVDTLELSALDDGSLFTRQQIIGGLWRDSRFFLFRYNWQDPSLGIEPLRAGVLGQFELLTGTIKVELRGLQQYLQQPVGDVTSKTCRARLGDSRCRKSLTTFTHSGTVTAVADAQNFTASGLTQGADYFGEGTVEWLTGDNAGLVQKVKAHSAGGVFQLVLPMVYAVAVGDTFTAVAGCRKRLEDCRDKFANVLNFQGEPHLQGIDSLTARPDSGGG